MESAESKEFFKQLYFRPVKVVSCLAGQWPYQTALKKAVLRGILTAMVGTQMISQIAGIIVNETDLDYFMELIPPFAVEVSCITKMTNSFFVLDKIKILLEKLQDNWKLFPDGRENELLHEHALFGVQMSALFLVTLYGAGGCFATHPYQAMLAHVVLNMNGSMPRPFLFSAYWGPIDTEKYYFPIVLTSTSSIYCVVTMLVAIDCIFYMGCGHVCGLCAALGHSIENFSFDDSSKSSDESFIFLRRCIQIHNRILEFAASMEDILAINFLIMLGSVTAAMSLTAVQMVINMNALGRLLKNVSFAITQITQLFIKCWMAQRVMDSTANVKYNLINSTWYRGSQKAQNLLGLMIMRSEIPCEISAGKIIIMNFETFSSIVRLSASYFTMFLALR